MDRRVLKTKKAIRSAYLELLRSGKEYTDITVKELVDLADINRSTFYLHYYTVDEVFEDLIDGMLSDISKEIPSGSLKVDEIEQIIGRMTTAIQSDRDYSTIAAKAGEYPYFSEALLNMMKDKVSAESISAPDLNTGDKEFLMLMLSQITYSVTNYLIKHYPAEQIPERFGVIKKYIFEPAIREMMH